MRSVASTPIAESPMSRPAPWVAVMFAGGIAADRLWPCATPDRSLLPIVVGLVAVWLVAWRVSRHFARRVPVATGAAVAMVAVCGGVFLFGAAYHHDRFYRFPATDVGLRLPDGESARVEGCVVTSPRYREAGKTFLAPEDGVTTEFTLEATAADGDDGAQPVSGRLRVFVNGSTVALRRGDRVRVVGVRRGPYWPLVPNESDSVESAQSQRTLASFQVADPDAVTLIAADGDRTFFGRIDALRSRGMRILRLHLGEETFPLAEAVLLGLRDDLSDETTDTFLRTGTIHLMAISGLHVGILAAMFFGLARLCRIPTFAAWGVTLAGVAAYVVLTGAQPPAVRAAIFLLLLALSQHRSLEGRRVELWAVALIVLLLIDPSNLFRIGFLYSFLCVGAILRVQRWFVERGGGGLGIAGRSTLRAWERREREASEKREELESRWPWWVRFRRRMRRAAVYLVRRAAELVVISLALWFVSAGLTLARFGQTAPGAVLGNFVAIGVMTLFLWGCFTLLAAAVIGLPAWLLGAVAWACDSLCGVLMGYLEWVATLPGTFMRLPPPPMWWLIGFHAVLALIVMAPHWCGRSVAEVKFRRAKIRIPRGVAMPVVWGVAGVWLVLTPSRPAGMEVRVVAVGHGSAVLVRMPDDATVPEAARGKTLLYDCGAFADPVRTAERIFRASWAWRVRRIDVVILSHLDSDHYNALKRLTDYFTIGEVLVGPIPLPDDSPETPESAESDRLPPDSLPDSAADGAKNGSENASVAGTPASKAAGLAGLKAPESMESLRWVRRTLAQRGVPIRLVTADEELWPGVRVRVFREPGPVTSTNANGLACRLDVSGRTLLLTGDVEGTGLASLTGVGVDAGVDPIEILVAPHHGSVNSCSGELLGWCEPRVVIVSSSASDYRPATEEFYRRYTDRVWFTWRDGSLHGIATPAGWSWTAHRTGELPGW